MSQSTLYFSDIDAARFARIEAQAQQQTGIAIQGASGSASKVVKVMFVPVTVKVDWSYFGTTLQVTIDTPVGMGEAVKDLTSFINSTA